MTALPASNARALHAERRPHGPVASGAGPCRIGTSDHDPLRQADPGPIAALQLDLTA